MSTTGNPKAAVDALADPDGLTLGQFVLLEKIASPYITGEEAAAADLVPSVFLARLPSAEGVRHLGTLTEEAFAWLDTLTPEQFRAERSAFEERLVRFFSMIPKAGGGSEKNGSQTEETAG